MSLIGVALEPVSSGSGSSHGVVRAANGQLQPRPDSRNAERIVHGLKTWVVSTHVYIATTGARRDQRRAAELRARHSRAAFREANAISQRNGSIILDSSASGSGKSLFVDSTLRDLTGPNYPNTPVFIGVDQLGQPSFDLATQLCPPSCCADYDCLDAQESEDITTA